MKCCGRVQELFDEGVHIEQNQDLLGYRVYRAKDHYNIDITIPSALAPRALFNTGGYDMYTICPTSSSVISTHLPDKAQENEVEDEGRRS